MTKKLTPFEKGRKALYRLIYHRLGAEELYSEAEREWLKGVRDMLENIESEREWCRRILPHMRVIEEKTHGKENQRPA